MSTSSMLFNENFSFMRKNTFHLTKISIAQNMYKESNNTMWTSWNTPFNAPEKTWETQRVTKDIMGTLMMENYKNVHSVHNQCPKIQIPHVKRYHNNTSCISTATLEQQPSNAFHTVNVRQSHLMCIYIRQPHNFSCKTKTENSNCISTGSFSKHLYFTRVGKVCLHWLICLNNTLFWCD